MSTEPDLENSRIIVTPRSGRDRTPGESSSSRTPDEKDEERKRRLRERPPGASGSVTKQMVKRALFPRKSHPVTIGRFNVLRQLGQGGMGVVYACYDDRLDRRVAVKVLRADLVRANKSAEARLFREAQAMARLTHPNVVTVHEVGETDGTLYVAMEFVAGTSLDVWLKKSRPWTEIMTAFMQAGRGLAAAHKAGLIHRDFKPQNVMITEEGTIKVLDFGLARATDGGVREEWLTSEPSGSEASSSHLLRPLTRTGVLLGTPAYMSAEQHRGEVATAASDQFSFCVSLYQGLYGQLPYATDSLEVLKQEVQAGKIAPPPPRSVVPQRIYQALRRGLAPEPEQRFGSMTELLAALERDPMRRFWRGAALVGTLVVSGGVSAALVDANQVEVCPDAGAELTGVWDPEQSTRVEAEVRARVPLGAAGVMGLVRPKLDDYATAWTTMRNEACLAHASGRQSAQLFDLRTSCLDQRRASLSAVVDVLMKVSDATLDQSIKAIHALPPLDPCADVESLTAAIPPPAIPELRRRVQQHREALARAEVLEVTSQTHAALSLVENVLADTEARAYEPLLAEAYLRKGTALIQERSSAALSPLDDALSTALRIGHSRVAALASSRRAWVLSELLNRPAEAQGDLFWVKSLNERVRKDVAVYKEYLNCTAAVEMLAGDLNSAQATLREAMSLKNDEDSRSGMIDIYVLGNSRHLNAVARRHEEALVQSDRVVALSEKLLGRHDSERPSYDLNRSDTLRRLGRPHAAQRVAREHLSSPHHRTRALLLSAFAELSFGDAASAYRHVLEALDSSLPPSEYVPEFMYQAAQDWDVAAVEALREKLVEVYGPELPLDGYTLTALGRHREAVEELKRERLEIEESDRLTERLQLAFIALNLGLAHQRLEAYDDAERELTEALVAYQGLVSPRNLELADVMLALGQLALKRRRFDEAGEWLRKAESIYAATAEPDYLPLTRTRTALAQVLGSRE